MSASMDRWRRELARVPLLQVASLVALFVWLHVYRLPLGYQPEWAYRTNLQAWPVIWLLPCVILTVTSAAICAGLVGPISRSSGWKLRAFVALLLCVLFLSLLGLQVSLLSIYPFWLRDGIAYQMSDVSTGYLAEAYRIEDIRAYTGAYTEVREGLPQHLATRGPGLVLFYYGLRSIAERQPDAVAAMTEWVLRQAGETRASVLAYAGQFPGAPGVPAEGVGVALMAGVATMVSSAAAATVVLAVLLIRAGSKPNRVYAAVTAAALVGLSPACLLFPQCPDMYVVLASGVCFAVLCSRQLRFVHGLCVGAVMLAGMLTSLSTIAILASTMLGLAIAALASPAPERRRAAAPLLGVLAGFALALVACRAAGIPLAATLSGALSAHSGIAGALSHRHYGVWVWGNLVEWSVFCGLPTAVLVAWRARALMRAALTPEHPWTVPAALGVSALICLLAIDLVGVVRGETGRILAPLMLPAIAAAIYAPHEDERRWEHLPALTLLLVLAQNCVMSLAMQPVNTPY